MYWYLYQDGGMALEMKLTGILSTSVQYAGEGRPEHGVLVAPGVAASNHQHFFCFRIDPAVDDPNGGRDLLVAEVRGLGGWGAGCGEVEPAEGGWRRVVLAGRCWAACAWCWVCLLRSEPARPPRRASHPALAPPLAPSPSRAQVNATPIPLGPQNPFGNAFQVAETYLESTSAAQRLCCPEAARHWKIKNPAHINPITREPVAYKLLPGSNVTMLAQPGSLIHRRAHFATKHLWVTPHDEEQKYPAGDHVVRGLPCPACPSCACPSCACLPAPRPPPPDCTRRGPARCPHRRPAPAPAPRTPHPAPPFRR
jgi:hypothetical protein